MGIFDFLDIPFLISLFFSVTLFCVLYYLIASKSQKKALAKVDASLKMQEHANQQFVLMLNELRRSNRLLSEIGALDSTYVEEPRKLTQNSVIEAEMFDSGRSEPRQDSNRHHHDRYDSLRQEDMDSDSLRQVKLYVGNIDYSVSEPELAQHFSKFGQIQFVNIPINRYTGRARGFGFVVFTRERDAERALALDGSEFKGRQIQVNFAKEREREFA